MFRYFLTALLFPHSLSAGTKILQSFEGDGFGDWKVEGEAFGLAPVTGTTEGLNGEFNGFSNESMACSAHGGDASTGALISPEFVVSEPYLTFLIAGGNHTGKTAAQLLVNGKVVREAMGKRDLTLRATLWDVREFAGKKAVFRIVDEETGTWGIIGVDHVMLTNDPKQKFPARTKGGKVDASELVQAGVIGGATIPAGTELKIAADSKVQKVISPTALSIDEKGRIFVAETHRFRNGVEDNRDRLYWFHEDMAAQTTADRLKMYEKWASKQPEDYYTKKTEIVRLLEDADGDGVMEKSEVFAENFNEPLDGTAAGIFAYEDTVYFACIPKLWMLRDTNGNGTADERKVIEDGFGVRVSFSGHDMNGFAIGPDGRIYGTIGDRGFSVTTKEGKKFHYPDQGAVFRFEPDGTGFEIMHTGLRNPKEIAFDVYGNAFSVDNNSDQGDAARIVYLVEGGDSGWLMGHQTMHSFHRQVGLENRPPNRWMDEKMWEMRNDSQPAYILPPVGLLTSGPSGLTVHPGTGFLENETGRFLICDYRGGASNSGIWSFEMQPEGAGMKLADSRRFMWGVAATDVEYSWDGRVFVTDFIGGWASHGGGRLLEINAGDQMWRNAEAQSTAALVREGFDHRNSAELVKLLGHADARVRIRAQIALTRKNDAFEKFVDAASSEEQLERIHGIWGLGILARRGSSVPTPTGDIVGKRPGERGFATGILTNLLNHKDDETRAQVLRVLADSPADGTKIPFDRLLKDPSPRVRFFAALAVGKLKASSHFEAVCEMIRENDNRDVHLRHAGIYALEHLASESCKLTDLSTDSSSALRLAATVALRRLHFITVAEYLNDPDSIVADEAIRAICDLDLEEVRPLVAEKLDHLTDREWTPFMLRRLIHNAYRIGGEENAARLLKVLGDASLPEPVRKEAYRLLTVWEEPHPADQFTGDWRPLEKRDGKKIHSAIKAALPVLLGQEGFVLTAALDLIDRFVLDIAVLDDATLKKLIQNRQLPAEARAKSLELLTHRGGDALDDFLISLAEDEQDEVSLAAMAALAERNASGPAVNVLRKAIASGKTYRAQHAWKILASIPGEASADVFVQQLDVLREAKGISPFALELMNAARSRKESRIVDALAILENSLTENSDPLAKWFPSLQGGDPQAGASLFESHPAGQCLRCHRAEDGHSKGGEAGPSLAGIAGEKDSRYFLESMVSPSAVIAPGYGLVSIIFNNGATLGGNLIAETDEHLDIEAEGKFLRIKRSDISNFTPPISSMPPMADLLNASELRDIIAWLGTLEKGGEVEKKTPVLLDPSTLPVPEKTAPSTSGLDPGFQKLGQQQFIMCAACHGQNGEGTPAGPPLAGSEWVNGPAENLIRIQLRGLQGPIKVKGVEYNLVMAPMAYQTDEQIAAVLTHIRSHYGNTAPAVTTEQVKALRDEAGKPMLTQDDLKPPVPEKAKN